MEEFVKEIKINGKKGWNVVTSIKSLKSRAKSLHVLSKAHKSA